MKKFTGIFLLGEHSFGNVLRKIGLSMVAILMAVVAYSQAQDTYHVFAEDVSDCYRYDNDYEVQISFRDFVKIDTFVLVLNYDEDVFSYTGVSAVHSVLQPTLQTTEVTAGEIQITWDSQNDPVANGTIEPNNDTLAVFTLHFALDGYPHAYGPVNQYVFSSDLTWDVSDSKFWDQFGQVTNILTEFTDNGSITATQGVEMDDIVIETGSSDCAGNFATVTVSAPASDGYSFNGSTFTANATTEVFAPTTDNTVRVMSGDCVSYIKRFDVDGPEALEFTTEPVVYTDCPGGLGDIEIKAKGGAMPYEYYVFTEAEWATLDFGGCCDCVLQACIRAASPNSVHQVPPGVYYVAMNDANDCVNVCDAGVWEMVEVMDTLSPIMITEEVTHLQCYVEDYVTAADGEIDLEITGGTQYDNDATLEYGYKVWFNDAYQGIVTTLSKDDLIAGTYKVDVQDANGCVYSKTIEVEMPDMISFWVDHTDASCNSDLGTITIDETSITGGSGDHADWWWVYSTMPDFDPLYTDTILVADGGIFTSAVDLPVGVYYIRIFDANGCFDDFKNPNGDNAVKVLTTEFDIVYDQINCFGGSTDVSIIITTGAGNHTFGYKMDDGEYSSDNVFENVDAGQHTFCVYDYTIDCEYCWTLPVDEPNPLSAEIVPLHTLPPTCPGNTDGNLTIHVTGGTPWTATGYNIYKYKVEDGDWVEGGEYNTFAVSTDEITIYIQDSTGQCPIEVKFDWPDLQNEIAFQDTIYNVCAEGMINLFNRYNEGCEPVMFDVHAIYGLPTDADLTAIDFDPSDVPSGILDGLAGMGLGIADIPAGFSLDELATWLNALVNDYQGTTTFEFWNPSYYNCPADETLDYGYLQDFSWYGIPMEHFTGVIDFEIDVWTSDSGWVTRTLQGIQQMRNPIMYITDVDPDGDPMAVVDNGSAIGHNSAFGAGTYWVVAKDEWGCFSNIEKIVIMDPMPLDVVWSTEDAGCAGSTDGKIMFEAFNGTEAIPNLLKPFARYQYVLTQQPQIFAQPNWVGEVSWLPLASGEFMNDSVGVINVQEGTYWLAVRDWCSVENTDLIWYSPAIVVEGKDPIEIAWTDDMIDDIVCNVYGQEDPSDDGAITGLLDATTGGFGDYTYTLTGNGVDESNKTGEFMDLEAGVYMLEVEDAEGCMASYEVEITEPDPLMLETIVVNPSCYDSHDGILRYKISGGTAPFMEATNNIGVWETPLDIPANRWVDTSTEAVKIDAHNNFVFDRRVRAGEYQIWIKDANGCIYGPVDVVVEEPGMLDVTMVDVQDAVCIEGNSANGEIEFMPKGGWDMYEDGFLYYIQLWSGTTVVETQVIDTLEMVTFTGLSAGDYTIKLYEYNPTIANDGYGNPVISYVDYFVDHGWLAFDPWQNPFLSGTDTNEPCYTTHDVSVGSPVDITYDDIIWEDVKCYNTHTGSITVPNITGGITDNGGYYVGLEGPADYDATLQSNYATNYEETVSDIVWFYTGENNNSFMFDNLIWGHYTVHIKDANDCWIYKESGEVENQDTLQIEVVELVENVKCETGSRGIIQIDALGGVPPYTYAVDSTLVPHPGAHTFPVDLDVDAYLASLPWQASDTFMVTAATWIGYVKDAMGCVVGFATYENGDPVYQHRTTVLGPTPVVATDFGDMDDQDAVECYGESNGAILIDQIYGGNGGAWTIEVTGTSAAGDPVEKTYTNVTSSTDVVLGGLPASTNLTDVDDIMAAGEYYTVVVYDVEGCVSEAYAQFVTQPGPFEIVLRDLQNAFVCPNDQAGLFEIVVISGGNPFGLGADDEPLYKYKWEAYEDAEQTMLIDSLSDDEYGFVNTFLGHAGVYYKVFALDALGCETDSSSYIEEPQDIEFSVVDLTCYGDELASARVLATGTPGRSFQVWWREFEGDLVSDPWKPYNGWFRDHIDIMDEFIFDNAEDVANPVDYHYEFKVVDTLGCQSDIAYITFDSVQHVLTVRADVISTGECSAEVEIFPRGGIPPYVVMVDDEVTTDMTMTLMSGEHTIKVTDSHLRCMDEVTVDIMSNPVVIEEEIMTYIGETVEYMNEEAGVDTMLAEGVHTFMYMHMMDTVMGCERTLEVTVVAVPRPLTVAEVQGEADASPWVDAVVAVTGTITGISEGEGFYMQDANAAWSGIWVEYTDTDALQIGQGVEVAGTVAEVASVTTLIATDVMPAIAPVIVEAIMVDSPTDAENEMYESVLVKVSKARATAADAATGEWTVYYAEIDDVVVNDLLYAYTPVEGDIYNVTGVVNARLDAFKLEPRMEEDIVNISATTDIDVVESVQFNVYPNPFNDRIMIDNNDRLTRVVVSNIAGQRVIDVEYPGHEIRTANLASGHYTVSMFTEEGLAKTERIVKR